MAGLPGAFSCPSCGGPARAHACSLARAGSAQLPAHCLPAPTPACARALHGCSPSSVGSVSRLLRRATTPPLCHAPAAHGGLPVSARPQRFSTTPHTPPASRGAALAEAARVRATQHSTPMAAYLAALVVGMVGATYGSVPLYRLFCQATGAQGGEAVLPATLLRGSHAPRAHSQVSAAPRSACPLWAL